MAGSILHGPTAVLYLRMSSEEQTGSIPSQRTELLKYAKAKGYKVVGEFVDEAISGDATERRSGFLAMRAAAERGEFQVVLCWDQDRFGRFDPLDAGYWIYPFRQAGVRLETIAQGPIDWEDLTGQLIYSVNQLGKAQFLRDLSRNTTRGLLNAVREGRCGTGGPTPYGYRYKDGKVSIVDEQAEVVRWIFAEYLKPGASIRGLATELNRRRVTPPRSNRWQCSSVTEILKRRKYVGSLVFGARNCGMFFSVRSGEIVPRRRTDKVAKAEPIVEEDRFDKIIDQDSFDRVQAKLAENRRNTSRLNARRYPLASLLKCGDCKGSMGGKKSPQGPIYICRTYHQTGRAVCYHNRITEAPLLSAVVRKIQETYTSKAALARLRKAMETEQDRSRPRSKDVSRLRREVKALDLKIDNAETAVLDAPATIRSGLYRKLEELTANRDRLRTELDALATQEARPERRDRSEIDEAISTLRKLGEALAEAGPEETKELLSSLVSKVELFFDHQDSGGGQKTSVFTHGRIYTRPGAGDRSQLTGNRQLAGRERWCPGRRAG